MTKESESNTKKKLVSPDSGVTKITVSSVVILTLFSAFIAACQNGNDARPCILPTLDFYGATLVTNDTATPTPQGTLQPCTKRQASGTAKAEIATNDAALYSSFTATVIRQTADVNYVNTLRAAATQTAAYQPQFPSTPSQGIHDMKQTPSPLMLTTSNQPVAFKGNTHQFIR